MSALELFIYTLLFLILLCLFIIILGALIYLIGFLFELLFYFFKIATILFVTQSYNLFCYLANIFKVINIKIFCYNFYLRCIYRPFKYIKTKSLKCVRKRKKILPISNKLDEVVIIINPNNELYIGNIEKN